MCDMVYLIESGEFEQFLKLERRMPKSIDTRFYTGPQKKKAANNFKVRMEKTMQHSVNAPITLLGKGMLMGDEDCLGMTNYSKTTKCKSLSATVWEIRSIEFFNLLKLNSDNDNCGKTHYKTQNQQIALDNMQFILFNQSQQREKVKTKIMKRDDFLDNMYVSRKMHMQKIDNFISKVQE